MKKPATANARRASQTFKLASTKNWEATKAPHLRQQPYYVELRPGRFVLISGNLAGRLSRMAREARR